MIIYPICLHELTDVACAELAQLVAEEQQGDSQQSLERGCHLGGHADGVVDAMGQDGSAKDEEAVAPVVVAEMDEGVVVAHEDSEEEMSRHRKQATTDGRTEPVLTCIKEVHDILQSRKTESDAHSIDHAVDVLVVLLVLAQEEPEHDELSYLLREGGGTKAEDGGRESIVVLRKKAGNNQRGGEDQRKKDTAHPIEERTDKLRNGFWMHAVATEDEQQKDNGGEECRKEQDEGRDFHIYKRSIKKSQNRPKVNKNLLTVQIFRHKVSKKDILCKLFQKKLAGNILSRYLCSTKSRSMTL